MLPGLGKRAREEVLYAVNGDNRFLNERAEDPQEAVSRLERALMEKSGAITVLPGSNVSGTKPVRVTASWQ